MTWDLHHTKSESLAIEAEAAVRSGRQQDAQSLYRQAGAEEVAALRALAPDRVRTRGITGVSAVALLYKGGAYEAAESQAREQLATSELPSFAQAQLRELISFIGIARSAEVADGFTLHDSLGSMKEGQAVPRGVSLAKKERARNWVNGYAATGGGVAAAAIIPGVTSAAIFAVETTMVTNIGRIYRGDRFSKSDAMAAIGAAGFAATIGLSTKIAIEGLNFFPIIGWAIKGAMAAGIIKRLGELIIKYFESIEVPD